MFKLFSKTIRPWRKTAEEATGSYEQGWNDCLAAMKKAEATWFKNMDVECKAKVIPIRPSKK